MRPRITIARFFLGMSRLFQNLPIALLRPDDMVEINRRKYLRPGRGTYSWNHEQLADAGLTSDEKSLLEKLPVKRGRLLILCVGIGREAIPMAKMGFQVTGIDFIPQMVERAGKNAEQRGVKIEGMVQEISSLDMPEETFDVAWLSAGMYSHIPTRMRRVAMLKNINATLKTGGYFLCEFYFDNFNYSSPKIDRIRKLFALLTLGNRWYEHGDMIGNFGNMEFSHAFSSEDEIRLEFEESGFKLFYFRRPEPGALGAAILKKDDTQKKCAFR